MLVIALPLVNEIVVLLPLMCHCIVIFGSIPRHCGASPVWLVVVEACGQVISANEVIRHFSDLWPVSNCSGFSEDRSPTVIHCAVQNNSLSITNTPKHYFYDVIMISCGIKIEETLSPKLSICNYNLRTKAYEILKVI